MKLNVYSMFDNKVDVFNIPIVEKDEASVIENIKRVSEDFKEYGVNPTDYELYELGEYETTTGKFNLLDSPKHLFSVNQIVAHKEMTEAITNKEEEK